LIPFSHPSPPGNCGHLQPQNYGLRSLPGSPLLRHTGIVLMRRSDFPSKRLMNCGVENALPSRPSQVNDSHSIDVPPKMATLTEDRDQFLPRVLLHRVKCPLDAECLHHACRSQVYAKALSDPSAASSR
jgi:hypothetical protein